MLQCIVTTYYYWFLGLSRTHIWRTPPKEIWFFIVTCCTLNYEIAIFGDGKLAQQGLLFLISRLARPTNIHDSWYLAARNECVPLLAPEMRDFKLGKKFLIYLLRKVAQFSWQVALALISFADWKIILQSYMSYVVMSSYEQIEITFIIVWKLNATILRTKGHRYLWCTDYFHPISFSKMNCLTSIISIHENRLMLECSGVRSTSYLSYCAMHPCWRSKRSVHLIRVSIYDYSSQELTYFKKIRQYIFVVELTHVTVKVHFLEV